MVVYVDCRLKIASFCGGHNRNMIPIWFAFVSLRRLIKDWRESITRIKNSLSCEHFTGEFLMCFGRQKKIQFRWLNEGNVRKWCEGCLLQFRVQGEISTFLIMITIKSTLVNLCKFSWRDSTYARALLITRLMQNIFILPINRPRKTFHIDLRIKAKFHAWIFWWDFDNPLPKRLAVGVGWRYRWKRVSDVFRGMILWVVDIFVGCN